jgi:cell division protein FtsQ
MAKNKMIVFILLLLISLLLFGIYVYLVEQDNFPITKVVLINKLHEQSFEELHQTAAQSITGGFFKLDMDTFRQKIEQLPWVESVSVRKKWPDALHLGIAEKIPAARWLEVTNRNKTIKKMIADKWDHESLISSHGSVFKTPLSDQQKHRHGSLALYAAAAELSENVLQVCAMLTQILAPTRLQPKKCFQDQRRSWYVKLSNGFELYLGRDINKDINIYRQDYSEEYLENKLLERMQTFVNAYQRILKKHEKYIQKIDLRYTNGFAVRWKPAAVEG